MKISLKISKMPCLVALVLWCLAPILSHANAQYRGMGSGTALKDFKSLSQQGFISKKPQVSRMDYNDVYVVKKPLKMFNQLVVLLSDEYMSEYVGCCVSEGWGAIVKKEQSFQAFKRYAEKNHCALTPFSLKDNEHYYGFATKKLRQGEYYELSCRERDFPDELR